MNTKSMCSSTATGLPDGILDFGLTRWNFFHKPQNFQIVINEFPKCFNFFQEKSKIFIILLWNPKTFKFCHIVMKKTKILFFLKKMFFHEIPEYSNFLLNKPTFYEKPKFWRPLLIKTFAFVILPGIHRLCLGFGLLALLSGLFVYSSGKSWHHSVFRRVQDESL